MCSYPDSAMHTEFPPAVHELLSVSAMTLATSDAGGMPHAAPVYFAADQSMMLYYFSDKKSRHSQDLCADPRAAVAIYPGGDDWRTLHGLQLHGSVQLIQPGAAWEAGWQVYLEKFPFVAALKTIVAQNSLYTFRPNWMRLVDNRRRFGFKQEWDLA